MSKRIEDLELQVKILEAQRDRVRRRTKKMRNACLLVATGYLRVSNPKSTYGQVAKLLNKLADEFDAIDHEYDRYYIGEEQ